MSNVNDVSRGRVSSDILVIGADCRKPPGGSGGSQKNIHNIHTSSTPDEGVGAIVCSLLLTSVIYCTRMSELLIDKPC